MVVKDGKVWIPIGVGHVSRQRIDEIDQFMTKVSQYSESNWPGDEYWAQVIPTFLKCTFVERTPAEAEEELRSTPQELWHTLPWDMGSWIDSLREREWEWGGFVKVEGESYVVLPVNTYPGTTEALVQLLTAAGIVIRTKT